MQGAPQWFAYRRASHTVSVRASWASRAPGGARPASSRALRSALFADVALDLEIERGNAMDLLGGRQHAHPAHAEVLQNLSAHAVGPEYFADFLMRFRRTGRCGS